MVHPYKPKLRVVFDCAAKSNGTPLNDKLLKRPDLMNDLLGVLLRFRQDKIAIVADIEAMFHQVRVIDSDRDAIRFLWWKGVNSISHLRNIACAFTAPRHHRAVRVRHSNRRSTTMKRTIETKLVREPWILSVVVSTSATV